MYPSIILLRIKQLVAQSLAFKHHKYAKKKKKETHNFQMGHFRLYFFKGISCIVVFRLRAKKGPAPPPLGNFADISYLKENFKPHLLRDVCTLCSGALVSDSLLHMLL